MTTQTPDTGAAAGREAVAVTAKPDQQIPASGEHAGAKLPGESSAGGRQRSGRAGRLAPAAWGLVAVVVFQLLFAGMYLGVLHRPALHHAPVAAVGTSQLGAVLSRHGDGAIRLVPEPTAQAARAAIHSGHAYAAILAGRQGESLVIETAASPGTATVLTKVFTTAAAAMKIPLQVRDLAPLPASDPTGVSTYFLIIAWALGGYVGATALGVALGGVRALSLRQVAIRLALLAAYSAVSGVLGALLFGPVIGVTSGYSVTLAGVGTLLVFAAATATAGLQAALGMPGTLLAVIAIVVFGNPTAGQSIATPLLASPWNVIGQGLPPGAGLTAARSMIYLNGANSAGPLTVLATYAAAGTLLMLAAAVWWPRRRTVPAA